MSVTIDDPLLNVILSIGGGEEVEIAPGYFVSCQTNLGGNPGRRHYCLKHYRPASESFRTVILWRDGTWHMETGRMDTPLDPPGWFMDPVKMLGVYRDTLAREAESESLRLREAFHAIGVPCDHWGDDRVRERWRWLERLRNFKPQYITYILDSTIEIGRVIDHPSHHMPGCWFAIRVHPRKTIRLDRLGRWRRAPTLIFDGGPEFCFATADALFLALCRAEGWDRPD